jgi:DNA polymerase-3 subunit delta'
VIDLTMHNRGGKLKFQEQTVKRLLTMIEKGTLPHALIFAGISGTGKKEAASGVAMALNCISSDFSSHRDNVPAGFQSKVCAQCRPCRKILSENHPDILYVRTEGKLIVISQIREIVQKLLGKPFEAAYRVVIIEEAGKMNTEASNALLKVLEEPPPNTGFILTTERADELLPTIQSRCQLIRFNPVSPENIKNYLVTQFNIETDRAIAMASIASGSIEKAEQLTFKNNMWTETRNFVSAVIRQIKGSSALFYLSVAEKIAKDRKTAVEILEIMKSYVRDMIVYGYSPGHVFNQDIIDEIAKTSVTYPSESLINMYEYIQSAQKSIESNSALRLTLEVMAMKIAEV